MNNSIAFGEINTLLDSFLLEYSFTDIIVVVDENSKKHCLPMVEASIKDYKLIEIESGEENKTLKTCEYIWQSLTDFSVDRHGLVINLGGGVIGDMGGFCAATYKRGIKFINIPTTLLSMVDASVGGKLGVDFGSLKNHIGLFQTPFQVFIDSRFLSTLPENELMSGYAEVIKHALITSLDDWHALQQTNLNQVDWTTIIHQSVAIKRSIVEQDFKESGIRKSLNFGHTIGHAIESYFLESDDENTLLHGEGVAIGMLCECFISHYKCGLPLDEMKEIENYITAIYRPINIRESAYSRILELCYQDKKNAGNKIQAVLLNKIGTATPDSEINSEDVLRAIRYYSTLNI